MTTTGPGPTRWPAFSVELIVDWPPGPRIPFAERPTGVADGFIVLVTVALGVVYRTVTRGQARSAAEWRCSARNHTPNEHTDEVMAQARAEFVSAVRRRQRRA